MNEKNLKTNTVKTENKKTLVKKPVVTTEQKTQNEQDKKLDLLKKQTESRIHALTDIKYPASVKSARDKAYFKFYCDNAKNKQLTIEQLQKLKHNPNYAGSNKADDAGIISRFEKFGLITYNRINGVITLISDSFEPLPTKQNQ